jgi:hypothetical protein
MTFRSEATTENKTIHGKQSVGSGWRCSCDEANGGIPGWSNEWCLSTGAGNNSPVDDDVVKTTRKKYKD